MCGAVVVGTAGAADISNTANVGYVFVPDDGTRPVQVSVATNTVTIDVLPAPTDAVIEFRRQASPIQGSAGQAQRWSAAMSSGPEVVAADGGLCRDPAGTFAPIPPVVGVDGELLDPTRISTVPATSYYPGEPVIIVVDDADRNLDSAVRELVSVTIETHEGLEVESLRMQETGPDTGRFAAVMQSVAMPPDPVAYNCELSISEHGNIVVSYDDPDAPALAITLSVTITVTSPPQDTRWLRLEHSVSVREASLGDLVEYRAKIHNEHAAPVVDGMLIDRLPPGFRLRPQSVRVGTRRSPAALTTDGGALSIALGTLAPGEAIEVAFVAEVGSGTPVGMAVNHAMAHAAGGISSNSAQSVVSIHEPLMTDGFTLVGNVVTGGCGAADAPRPGASGIRLLLDDGTYVTTDENGAYHFEGVRPGTHVVQVDLATLPAGYEVASCRGDTRSAGRGFSRFVEAQGGTMWREDFRLRRAAPASSPVRLALRGVRSGRLLEYTVELAGGDVAVSGVRVTVMMPEGAEYAPGTTRVDDGPGADPEVDGNLLTFDAGDPGMRWRRQVRFSSRLPPACPGDGYRAKAMASFTGVGETVVRTPQATVAIDCDGTGPPATGSVEVLVSAAAEAPAVLPFAEQRKAREAIVGDVVAAGGGNVDWLAGQAAGEALLFPAEGYNPRSPATRVVVKHRPGDRVSLLMNGDPVSPLQFDGVQKDAGGGVAASVWRGVPLLVGENRLDAQVVDGSGTIVWRMARTIHFSGAPVRAELVPEQSILVADGLATPVIAVRLTDRGGHPVRAGLMGEFELSPPYLPAETVRMQQQRQLAGTDGARPAWVVEGDDGIAYIELAPTTVAGSVALGFVFREAGQRREDRQELRAWLATAPRDWVVVGFAAGSVGHGTLARHMEALAPGDAGDGVRTEGQVSLYAKGRVLGQWMLTLAYDSDKPSDQLRRRGLLSTIDPGRYYTLYGDGTSQGYDASSAEKLYLKLERDQFYAMFGDFQTGLDRTELSRYQRVLNGIKVEYSGPLVEFNGFAARTAQDHARDEIPGNGTSGLYRLSHGNIAINGERVRIETRDRFHSERIIDRRELVRHLDYDIDYADGTLLFREPVASRDFAFNPIWIVVDYETLSGGEESLDMGGRVGIRAMDGRLQAGATVLGEDAGAGRRTLAGVDVTFRPGEADVLRAELAASRGGAGDDGSAAAWLAEWEHRGERLGLLAYARRQAPGFGLGQQSRSQAGMMKAGVQARWTIDDQLALQGEAYRLENLSSDAIRNVASAELAYQGEDWTAKAGLQWARDSAASGQVAESRQVTLGGTRLLLDRRLELSAQAEIGLDGGNDSIDFPNRLQLGAAYRLNDAFRLVGAQEFTDGEALDSSTTRFGFEATPWKNAILSSTLNQSQFSEHGPRTYAMFGLSQKFLVGERWGFDVSVDSSTAIAGSGDAALVVEPAGVIAPAGFQLQAQAEDFVALSGGATYRAETWSWNGRIEGRQGDASDRYGLSTAFLRQARDGVALSASLHAFSQQLSDGSSGLLANAQLSWAWRPLGSRWSMLDKLEFRLDEVSDADGTAIIGPGTLATSGDARSRRLVNNFVLNYAADAWDSSDGNVLDLQQRSQFSIYYGSKYVMDTYGGRDHAGYSDIVGVEWRHDLTDRLDVGLRSSVMHSWKQGTFAWAFGPSVGFSPFTNTWVSVGYNVRGFEDRDFGQAHHTAEGAYVVFRVKFDQESAFLRPALAALEAQP